MFDNHTNRKIAETFRTSKPFLLTGNEPQGQSYRRYTTICSVLDVAADKRLVELRHARLCKQIVMERLGKSPTVALWLLQNGHIQGYEYAMYRSAQLSSSSNEMYRKIQAYRHAWLDSLADMFEQYSKQSTEN